MRRFKTPFESNTLAGHISFLLCARRDIFISITKRNFASLSTGGAFLFRSSKSIWVFMKIILIDIFQVPYSLSSEDIGSRHSAKWIIIFCTFYERIKIFSRPQSFHEWPLILSSYCKAINLSRISEFDENREIKYTAKI